MTTIPQVARAMREILTTTADEAARTTRFVQRTSPLGGATFTQTLVFGFRGHPQASLEELPQTAATLGVESSPQALEQRFTTSAATWVTPVLDAALARGSTAAPVALPVLARFTAVAGQDRSTIVLPDALAAVWPGGGGSTPESTSAARKRPVRLDMRTGCLAVQFQDGRASERTADWPGPLPAGALRLADLGDWRREAWQALAQQGVCWLSRLQLQTAVYDAAGARQDLLAFLEASPTDTVEPQVTLGLDQRVPARLLALRVPQDVAAARRRRLRAAAQNKGRQGSAVQLARAAWTVLVTNVPAARLTLREALVLARVRWHIALLLQRWQSQGRVDESRRTKPWRILCAVYAKLLAMLVQHGVFVVSCWAYPDRSLTQAAQTVPKHALPLARAFARVKRLTAALLTVKRCLAAGCRMNRRKKHPNTSQLLLDAIGP
jgi:DDE family transposase